MPGLAERVVAAKVERDHFQDRPAEPTSGNLFEPMPGWASVQGGWKKKEGVPWGRLAVVGLAVVGLSLAARRRHQAGGADGGPERRSSGQHVPRMRQTERDG